MINNKKKYKKNQKCQTKQTRAANNCCLIYAICAWHVYGQKTATASVGKWELLL